MLSKRNILKGAISTAALSTLPARTSARSDAGTPRLLLGPMIGYVGPESATVWVMVNAALPVSVEYADNPGLQDARRTLACMPSGDQPPVLKIEIPELDPLTEYWFRVLIDGFPDKYHIAQPLSRFRTAPPFGEPTGFTLGFGSCARIQYDARQPIWNAVSTLRPDLFLWLGDNVYADSHARAVFELEYQRQRGVAAFQPVMRHVPQLAIWDDHDFGLNNHDRENPVKEMALEMFKRYWANPAYGIDEQPGVFFKHSFGAVDLFCLDGRWSRDPNAAPDEPGKTLLGAKQLDWLKQGLIESDAVFKILACGSGWSVAKGAGGDSWASFLHERNALFDFIRDNEISGVLLISGDTHAGELNAIPRARDGGYDLYDLVSSPLAQTPSLVWMLRTPEVRMRKPFSGDNNFGLLRFTFDDVARIRFELRDTQARCAWEPFELTIDQLRNGAASLEALSDG